MQNDFIILGRENALPTNPKVKRRSRRRPTLKQLTEILTLAQWAYRTSVNHSDQTERSLEAFGSWLMAQEKKKNATLNS